MVDTIKQKIIRLTAKSEQLVMNRWWAQALIVVVFLPLAAWLWLTPTNLLIQPFLRPLYLLVKMVLVLTAMALPFLAIVPLVILADLWWERTPWARRIEARKIADAEQIMAFYRRDQSPNE